MIHSGGVEDGVGQLGGGEIGEMKQNKVQKVRSRLESFHLLGQRR